MQAPPNSCAEPNKAVTYNSETYELTVGLAPVIQSPSSMENKQGALMLSKGKVGSAVLCKTGAALGVFLGVFNATSHAASILPTRFVQPSYVLGANWEDPDCQVVLGAMDKMYSTPYHAYTSITGMLPGKTFTGEMIFVGGSQYVLSEGKWSTDTLSAAEMKDMAVRARKNAKHVSCHKVRDDSVNGETATVYGTHEETEHGTTDTQIWISKSKGLMLRQEMDLTAGTSKTHMSSRYEYRDVQAPKL